MMRILTACAVAAVVAGCNQTAAPPVPPQVAASAPAPAASQRMPSKNEQVCMAAVSRQTNNGDVILLSSESSQANDIVMVGVGPQRAQWKCLVKNGRVAEVSSMTDEGKL